MIHQLVSEQPEVPSHTSCWRSLGSLFKKVGTFLWRLKGTSPHLSHGYLCVSCVTTVAFLRGGGVGGGRRALSTLGKPGETRHQRENTHGPVWLAEVKTRGQKPGSSSSCCNSRTMLECAKPFPRLCVRPAYLAFLHFIKQDAVWRNCCPRGRD